MRTSKEDLQRYVRFSTIVRRVEYQKETDEFTVLAKSLVNDGKDGVERFSHVIIATGIFSSPHWPSISGMDKFPGRILHSHNFREAREFHGQRILVVGLSFSGEDLALQTLKYGAKDVIICGRQTRGLKWPPGLEERAMVERLSGSVAHFQDGSSAEVDVVIFCTGYKARFPFLADELTLKIPENSFYPTLYKGILWTYGGNNKLLYLGMQNQLYTMTMFDAQALWVVQYIMGVIKIPKTKGELLQDIEKWQKKLTTSTTIHCFIDFQRDYLSDLVKIVSYMTVSDVHQIAECFHEWENHRCENISTFRDRHFRSVFTGTLSTIHHTPYMKSYEDCIDEFTDNTP